MFRGWGQGLTHIWDYGHLYACLGAEARGEHTAKSGAVKMKIQLSSQYSQNQLISL